MSLEGLDIPEWYKEQFTKEESNMKAKQMSVWRKGSFTNVQNPSEKSVSASYPDIISSDHFIREALPPSLSHPLHTLSHSLSYSCSCTTTLHSGGLISNSQHSSQHSQGTQTDQNIWRVFIIGQNYHNYLQRKYLQPKHPQPPYLAPPAAQQQLEHLIRTSCV